MDSSWCALYSFENQVAPTWPLVSLSTSVWWLCTAAAAAWRRSFVALALAFGKSGSQGMQYQENSSKDEPDGGGEGGLAHVAEDLALFYT